MTTDEEEYGRFVLTPLREEHGLPLGASTVDVGEAVVRGRRRVRVRRMIGAGCAAAAAVVVAAVGVPLGATVLGEPAHDVPAAELTGVPADEPAPSEPAPPTTCTVGRLQPDLADAVATAVDPTGRWILGHVGEGAKGVRIGLVWRDGSMNKVALPEGEQAFTAVNAAGVAVAGGYAGDYMVGWTFSDDKMLPLRAKTEFEPRAIGEDGTIVGHRYVGRGLRAVPVVWSGPRATARDLPLPGKGWSGYAVDVSPDGTILGSVADPRNERRVGYLWRPDGTTRELPLPVDDGKPAAGFAPVAMGARWIAGFALVAWPPMAVPADLKQRSPSPVLYDRQTGAFRVFPELGMFIRAGNARGWVVGESTEGDPLLLSEAGPLRLPRATGMVDYTLTGLSDDGRTIVGHARKGKRTHALVWNCR